MTVRCPVDVVRCVADGVSAPAITGGAQPCSADRVTAPGRVGEHDVDVARGARLVREATATSHVPSVRNV